MKKGFTLVELLAVIVLIALLSTIAITSSMGISKSINEDMFCEKVDLLVKDAQRWGDSHQSQLSTSCTKVMTISDFIKQGVIKNEAKANEDGSVTEYYLLNPVTGTEMEGTVGVYLRGVRAYAYYIYSDSEKANELPKACGEDLPICGSGQSSRDASGNVVCIERPVNICK